MSLRLRQDHGAGQIQTLKCGMGLKRKEFEWPAPDGLDLGHADLRAVIRSALRKRLAPAFTVSIHRRQRTFLYHGAIIELALDEGEVHSGNRTRRICEVELELKSGSPSALFDLASDLSRVAPLRLSFLGKASQGQILLRPDAVHAPAPRPEFTRDTHPGLAFQALTREAHINLALQAESYSEFGGPRDLHALRVSARRLKSLLTTFRSLLDKPGADRVRGHLSWLLQVTADARNLDVLLLAYPLDQVPEALARALKARVDTAHAKAQAGLASGRFRDLLLEIAAWIETGAWQGRDPRAIRRHSERIRHFARRALQKSWQALARCGDDLESMEPADRHQVRLRIKRLRYGLEVFAPLFSVQDTAACLKTLKSIQTDLGDLNDLATARDLLQDFEPGTTAPLFSQLIPARSRTLKRRLVTTARTLKRLLAAPPPWST